MVKSTKSFAILCLAARLGNLYFRMPQVLPAQVALLVGLWQSFLLFGLLWVLRVCGKDWKSSGFIRGLLVAAFLFSASVDLMDLNRFYQTAYPQQLPGWLLALLIAGTAGILAGAELRTLKNLTRIFFPLLGVSILLLLLSCVGQFQPANLTSWSWEEICPELLSWQDFIPWPEYLALALWDSREGTAPLLWIPLARTGIYWLVLTMAELAMGNRGAYWPAHSLSLLGQLSVFNRLEWIQITLWLLLLMTRQAFYLYVGRRILGLTTTFSLIAISWTGFIIFSFMEPDLVWTLQRGLLWGVTAILLIRGLCRWEKPSKFWDSAAQ